MSESLQAGLNRLNGYLAKPPERAPPPASGPASRALTSPPLSHARATGWTGTVGKVLMTKHFWYVWPQGRPEPVPSPGEF